MSCEVGVKIKSIVYSFTSLIVLDFLSQQKHGVSPVYFCLLCCFSNYTINIVDTQ